MESTGKDPFETSPEQMQLAYLDYLRRARTARSLPNSMAGADAASVATVDGQQVETSILGGLKKGVQAGAMRVGSMVASPFVSEEQSAQNFASANKRSSEVQGTPAKVAGMIAQTGTEMAPLIGAALVTGGAALPAIGAGGARAVALATAAGGAGLQSGVPEYFERRGGEAGGPIGTPSKPSFTPEHAAQIATAKGISTAAVTALFGLSGAEALANPVAQKAARAGVREYLGAMAGGAGKEGLEEATDEVLQAFADKHIAGDTVTLGDFVERAATAGLLGGLFGAAGEVGAKFRESRGAAPAISAVSSHPPVKPAASPAPAANKPAGSSLATASPGQIGVVMRGVLNGSVDPTALDPQAQGMVADLIRQQLPKGRAVPPEITAALAKLEPQHAGVQPSPAAVPVGGTGSPGPVKPAVAPIVPPVAPVASAPVPAPVGPPGNPARVKSRGTASPYTALLADHAAEFNAPPAAQPAAVTNPPPAQSAPVTAPATVPAESDVPRGTVKQESIQAVQQGQTGQGQTRQEGQTRQADVLKPAAPRVDVDADVTAALRDAGRLAKLVTQRGVRTGPAPEDPQEHAAWSARLTHAQGERILAHLGDKPTGLNRQTAETLKRALGKTPAAEARLLSKGFVPKAALAERAAAPKVDTQAPTERIVRKKEPARADVRPVAEAEPSAPAAPEPAPAAEPTRPDLELAPVPVPATEPAKPAGRRAFDVAEEPASPTYTNRIRERVRETIAAKRKTGGTELRPGTDSIIEALGDNPTVDTNAKATAAVRKRVVSKAKVNGKETTLYEAPNGWGKSINEYTDLFKKHGRVLRSEQAHRDAQGVVHTRSQQLAELPADAPADVRSLAVAQHAKALAESEAARAKTVGAKPVPAADRARLRELSNGVRAQFADAVAKQAAELIRGTPASKREAVAARIEHQIETGDLAELISEDLVDPSSLRGVNARVFLADVDNGFALVSPHPKKPGEYITLDRTGEPSAAEPFVSDQLGELVDLLSARDLSSPMSTDAANAEGLGGGLPDSAIRAGSRGAPKVTDKNMAPKDWETAELFISRILMTDTNGDVNDAGKKTIRSVNAAELEKVLHEKFGDAGVKTLSDFVRIKAIDRRGDNYVSLPMSQHYRRVGPSMTGTNAANPTNDTVLSEQAQIEKAAVLLDLDVRTGMRHGIELEEGTTGLYDMNARSIALGQFDLGTFFHELFHDITIDEVGKRSSPMPVVQNELVKAATDNKQPALMSEGAAELGRIYVQDPAAARRRYPAATAWVEGLLAARGLKGRVDSITESHQAWLKASPEQRRKAAIVSKDATKDKTAGGSPWFRIKNYLSTRLFDRLANLQSVSRALGPAKDQYDDAYHAKMLEAGWPKAAADAFINGFITDARTGVREPGFGSVMDRATQLGITPEQFTDWQAYLAGMSIFDKSPRLRRKIFNRLGIDETKHGAWAIPGANLPDPFETIQDVSAANAEMDLDWEQKAAQNKALGKPAPPKPVHYKVIDPSPGGGEAPTNFTDAQLEDFANIIAKHDTDSAFHSLAETHMAAINNFDAWKVRQGLMSKSVLKSHQQHAYYVPLRTESADGQRVKIKGSGGAEIIAPYEQLWDKVRTAHFYAASQAAPRAWLRYITGVRAERIAAGNSHDETEFPLARLASFTDVDAAIKNYASIQSKIKKTGQESPVVDEYLIVALDADTVDSLLAAGLINPLLTKNPESLIGTHIAYRVEDPDIRSALGDPSIAWTPALHWIFRAPAGALRKLTTVFNPEFWVKTVVRDTYQAGLQTAAGRNPFRIAKTTGQGIMDAYTNASNLASDRAKTDPIYAAFVQSGVTSSSLLADSESVTSVLGAHDLSRALSMMGAHNPRFGWLRSLATPLNRVADTVEGFNRASEFRRSISDGLAQAKVSSLGQLSERQAKSILIQAARNAQEVTVNFRRMGSWSPLRTVNEMVPFFNAAIQGSARGLKTLTFQQRFPGESMGKRLVNGLTVYTMLALPVLLQHLMVDDPEKKDAYDELPDNERMLFYHFPAGRDAAGKIRWVRIVKPQGPFVGAIAAMEKMMAGDPRTWTDIGWDTYSQVAPQSIIPTALQLPYELVTGERLGQTASRVGVPYRLQGVTGDTQDAPWLSPSSYSAANALQAMGWSSASPLMVENLVRGYTGGLGWTVLDVPPTLQDLVGKHERASYDAGQYPVTRLFLARDPAFASRSITRVYDLLDVLNSQRKTYDQEISRAENGQQTPDQAVSNILDRPLTGFGKGVDDKLADFRAALGKSRTLWEATNRDATLDPIQRRIEMDKIVEQMVDASRLVYKTVTELARDEKIDLKVPRR